MRLSSTIVVASSGTSDINDLTPLRALPAANDSSFSPTMNSTNTIADSAVSPKIRAPTVATAINVSMANGVPERANLIERLITGITPNTLAKVNNH